MAELIRGAGGSAEAAAVDVVDRAAVEAHAAAVAAARDGIDIAFNATSNDDIQGTPLTDMAVQRFPAPHHQGRHR